MSVLWLALGIYIVGVILVLFFRPSLMFREGAGTWKEFGLNTTGNYTLFPFWMFTIIWALISYVFATLTAIFFAGTVLPKNGNINIVPISSMPAAAPVPVEAPVPQNLPGYYILKPTANGMPEYVFFGTSPPTLQNLGTYAGQTSA